MEKLKARLENVKYTNKVPKRKLGFFNLEAHKISHQSTSKTLLGSYKLQSPFKSLHKSSVHTISSILAKKISHDINFWENPENIKVSYFNQIDLSKMIDIVKEFEQTLSETQQKILESIVLYSKETDEIDIASSNALTILNFSQFQFKNKNFEKIRAPYADLSRSVFINTSFENSDLSYAKLSQCYFYQSNFKNCDLSHVKFYELPIFQNGLEITSFTISASGKYLACLPTAKIWEINTNRGVEEIPTWASDTALAFSPCEKYIAIATKRCEVELWEIETKKLIWKIFEGNEILEISYSPCGRFLMTQAKSFINIWRIKDRLLVKNLSGDYKYMNNTILFSPYGSYFTFGERNKGLEIYKTEDLSYIKTFNILGNYLVCFSCGNWVFAGNFQGVIYLFDLKSEKTKNFRGHLSAISSIDSMNFEGKTIIVTSCNRELWIKLWDAESFSLIWKLASWSSDQNTLNFPYLKSKFSNSLLFVNFCTKIKAFDIKNILKSISSKDSQNTVYNISITDDNKFIITFGKNPKFNIWDTQNNRKLSFLDKEFAYSNNVSTVSCLYNKSYQKRKVVIADFYSQKRRCSIIPCPRLIDNLKISSSGKYFAFNINLKIEIWDTDLNECVQTWSCKDQISDIALSPCGKYLISMHRTINLAYLWKIESLQNLKSAPISKNFKGLALSHSGMYFAWWNSKSVELWDFSNWNKLSFDYLGIQMLVFSAHNKYMAICDIDGKIILWEIESRSIVFERKNFSYRIKFLVFSDDESHIATYGNDGNIKLWNIGKDLSHSLEWSSKNDSVCNYESDFSGSKLSVRNQEILNYRENFDTLENFYLKYREY
ncbi:unnamed protein product [Blepharisma stoltei]|uniref:Uncharacterized protein n=1 Tax=Blepharisma stoltei TaxID=1481888 RepID=A0AAU9JVR1_9CILI|nr:unnamed protein product [Blepharisma stoltei]